MAEQGFSSQGWLVERRSRPLREKVKQAGLAFLIFGQRNKTGTALRNLSINKPERTICANNIIRYITESQKRGSVFFYPFFT